MFYFLSLFITSWLVVGSLFTAESREKVLVTIAPYRFFVKEIGGDDFDVEVMVPVGSSAHSFEPSPRQMVNASTAKVWFALGESFEPRVIRAIKSMNPSLEVIDLRDGVDLIKGEDAGHCHHNGHCHKGGLCLAQGFDPHMWLSPKEVKVQISTIEKTLSRLKPENSKRYQERAVVFREKLDAAETLLKELLPKSQPVAILVSHPSFGYMARDFGLYQICIEFEGREPTQKQVLAVVEQAKAAGVKTVFTQVAHPSKGAKVIADYLGADIKIVDPYSEDYFPNLKKMAEDFSSKRTQ